MRHLIIAGTLAVLIAACGSYGGTPPVGGYATGAPNAATPNGTPLPTGNPSVDNYGY